jgi:hypothetical protein
MAGRPMLTARSRGPVSRCRPAGRSAARGGLGCRWSTSMPAPGGCARGLSWPRASGLPLGGASQTGSRPSQIRLRLPASPLRWGDKSALIRTPRADFEKCHTAPPSQSGSGAGHPLPALAGVGKCQDLPVKPHRIDARNPRPSALTLEDNSNIRSPTWESVRCAALAADVAADDRGESRASFV